MLFCFDFKNLIFENIINTPDDYLIFKDDIKEHYNKSKDIILNRLNTEFKKGSNIIVNLDANDEIEISLTEGTVSETEDDKPKRRRFALSTIRKRKQEEEKAEAKTKTDEQA